MLIIREKDLLFGAVMEFQIDRCRKFWSCPYVQAITSSDYHDVTGLNNPWCQSIPAYDPYEELVYDGPCLLWMISEIQANFPIYLNWTKWIINKASYLEKKAFLSTVLIGTGILFSGRNEKLSRVNCSFSASVSLGSAFVCHVVKIAKRLSPRNRRMDSPGWENILRLFEFFVLGTEPVEALETPEDTKSFFEKINSYMIATKSK